MGLMMSKWVGNRAIEGNKSMAGMGLAGILDTRPAVIPIGTRQAPVTDAHNALLTSGQIRIMLDDEGAITYLVTAVTDGGVVVLAARTAA
jgi:hypothetical protein